jgi:hypothetical protein
MQTIPRIDGNSKIGNPVFSELGKRDNFRYMVFQPSYDEQKAMRDSLKTTTDMTRQLKMYKGFANDLPQLGERLKENV